MDKHNFVEYNGGEVATNENYTSGSCNTPRTRVDRAESYLNLES
jgi:hypothetical protein